MKVEIDGKDLFKAWDELEFKKQFVIQFLAAHDAVNFLDNCHRGWNHHKPAVEDASDLAWRAWDAWVNEIGLSGDEK